MFHTWLSAQAERQDLIGVYARLVLNDPTYPKTSRLFQLLRYERPPNHLALKRAHREWRHARRVAA
jgi:hypothetical protein